MTDRHRRGRRSDDAHQRRLRQSWWSLIVAFGALAALTAVRLVLPGAQGVDYLIGVLIISVGLAGVLHRHVIADLEHGRRTESESFQRILQGLSRSVSPDAIVDAIVEDLGVVAGADHTVVVRLRADARLLEATLVSSRAGVPSSTTVLPLSDLEDPGVGSMTGHRRRPPVAVPIEPAPVGFRLPVLADDADALIGTGASSRAASTGGPAVARLRIRDRVMPGLRGRRDAPLDEWEDGPDVDGAGPRRVGSGVVHASQAGRGGGEDAEWIAGPAAAAERIAEQLASRVRSVYGLKNTLSTALVTDQGVVGAIVLSRRLTEPWSPATTTIVRAAAAEASAALERAYSYREAEARASTDALTGLPNRRYFEEFCGLLARRRRSDDAVGLLMIDIDHFKRLNDQFGHPVGDLVLRAVAGAITGAVRDGDVPARFGGEEFAVLLRNPGAAVAMDVGERVRSAVGALDLSEFGPTGVTVSVGVAVARSADQPISDLVDEADHALYRAKRMGRDRVVAAA